MPREGHEIFSDVYLSEPFEKLPIADSYKDFVRKPTGVIERLFGHPVFMMELSRRIIDGESWKLGAFAAHALLHEGRLAQRDERPTLAIWCTGSVARDENLTVGSVEHLEQKLESSAELFTRCGKEGVPVILFVPAADLEKLDPAWLATWRSRWDSEARIRMVPVTSAAEICGPLGLELPSERSAPTPEAARGGSAATTRAAARPGRPHAPPRDRSPALALLRPRPVALAILAATIAGGVVVWTRLAGWIELTEQGRYAELESALDEAAGSLWPTLFGCYTARVRPDAEDIVLDVVARVLPDGRNCALAEGRGSDVLERAVARQQAGRFGPTSRAGLCSTIYRARNAGEAPLQLWLEVTPLAGGQRYERQRRQGRALTGRMQPGQSLSVSIEPRVFAREDTRYRIFAAAARGPSPDILTMISSAGETREVHRGALAARLERLGLATRSAVHEIHTE